MRALGMAQHQVLVRVGVRADVRPEVAPRERREREADVDDDAVRLVVDLVLVDGEVRVVDFRRRRERRDARARAGRREVVRGVVRVRPREQADERAVVALERLIVVGVRVDHRQVGVQPRRHLALRRAGEVDLVQPVFGMTPTSFVDAARDAVGQRLSAAPPLNARLCFCVRRSGRSCRCCRRTACRRDTALPKYRNDP